MKVTFVCFGVHARRFKLECAEHGNTLFSYFDVIIYVSWNFTLDSSICTVITVSHRLGDSHLLYKF